MEFLHVLIFVDTKISSLVGAFDALWMICRGYLECLRGKETFSSSTRGEAMNASQTKSNV